MYIFNRKKPFERISWESIETTLISVNDRHVTKKKNTQTLMILNCLLSFTVSPSFYYLVNYAHRSHLVVKGVIIGLNMVPGVRETRRPSSWSHLHNTVTWTLGPLRRTRSGFLFFFLLPQQHSDNTDSPTLWLILKTLCFSFVQGNGCSII